MQSETHGGEDLGIYAIGPWSHLFQGTVEENYTFHVLNFASKISERAKEVLAARGLPQSDYSRLKKLAADERKIKLGDEAIDYLLDQLVEMLMHSANVDEIFSLLLSSSEGVD